MSTTILENSTTVNQKMNKIVVVGTRGIPNIPGGIETHCAELYPRLVSKGYEIKLINRKPYVNDLSIDEYKGVKLINIYSPKKKHFEAIVHTFLSVFYAWFNKPDILHIHAIGPSLLIPLARILGMKIIVTNHGPDYERKKWNCLAKKILKLGEYWGIKYAAKVIVISNSIKSSLEKRYGADNCVLIRNGVSIPKKSGSTDYITSLGLEKGNYIFTCGRFVEEKGFHDLIAACNGNEYNLVIAGDSDHITKYSQSLKSLAISQNVLLPGYLTGEKLHQLFSHARLFILPSYHEGLPIALLEAMSYYLDVLVSDIPANKEVDLPDECYFKVGDIDDLKQKLSNKLNSMTKCNYELLLKKHYNWDFIAEKTEKLYKEVLI